MNNIKRIKTAFILLTFINTSCGQKNGNEQFSRQQSLDLIITNPEEITEDSPEILFKPMICSRLSFTNVAWPASLTATEINSLALAMNLSGSFEGHIGWKNIANNFDGQGLSLGLFNQNLGQGSLQPLMILLDNKKNKVMRSFFSKTQYTSVAAMLSKWGGIKAVTGFSKALPDTRFDKDTSELDDPTLLDEQDILHDEFVENELDDSGMQKAVIGKNKASVSWAVTNLYNGKTFKPEWRTALQKMAASPEYVTYQVAAALKIHKKAMGYMRKFGFKELRAYLFFFDVVVQNGGLTLAIENKYIAWAKANTKSSESTKLRKMLEYRLTLVKAIYVKDVRSRKLTMIDGKGYVHGANRDIQKEYCAPGQATKVL